MASGCWSVYYTWPQRIILSDTYAYTENEAGRLRHYPRALCAYGMHAWLQNDPELAINFFRQAVSRDVLHFDAWLRLAEIEAAMGNRHLAKTIVTFTDEQTGRALRWKWPQALLAGELGMDAMAYRALNELLDANWLVQDTLQLLHTHLGGDTSAVVAVLAPEHLNAYLDWLMQWGMADESMTVWQSFEKANQPDKSTVLRYAHFLITHKRIDPAKDIWQMATGIEGLTNPGFEEPITKQGFDWRYWDETSGFWELQRTSEGAVEGEYALKITFKGRENLSFQNLYQIVATVPGERYRLSYAWKSIGITTDQGPHIEVLGYGAQGLYRAGPAMRGTNKWQNTEVDFSVPVDCRAALIRLRRQPSLRFDSKIRGTIWLDDFQLEIMPPEKDPASVANVTYSDIINALKRDAPVKSPFSDGAVKSSRSRLANLEKTSMAGAVGSVPSVRRSDER